MKKDKFYHKNETADPTRYDLLKEFARQNRQYMTEAESALWDILKQKPHNLVFRRQHIIDDYIADFICLKKKLIIEVDGEYHNNEEQETEDKIRECRLRELGFNIIRFTNRQILTNLDETTNTIFETILTNPQIPSQKD